MRAAKKAFLNKRCSVVSRFISLDLNLGQMLLPEVFAMRKIAFLKSSNTDAVLEKTGFLDEFALLEPLFKKHGATLVKADWRDPQVNWEDFALIIPKCAWDYFDHYLEFFAWLKRVSALNVRFINSEELIKWNSHKHYLLELQNKGASVAPLRLISDSAQVDTIRNDLDKHARILLKPAVSGGGKQTKVYAPAEVDACLRDANVILKDCSVVVQPFLSDIASGEWSYFFFGGKFSHAIAKIPKTGDFRAHSLFGARNLAMSPGPAKIDEAQAILQYLPHPCSYARVDGLYVKDRFFLIELELIEPYLYFETAPQDAPEAFVKAVLE